VSRRDQRRERQRRRRRNTVAAAVAVVVVLAAGGAALLVGSGHKSATSARSDESSSSTVPAPTTTQSTPTTRVTTDGLSARDCPLTGLPAPGGKVPARPALAVKIDNYPAARPQASLDHTDLVFEEPVEGGITRFIGVYQCTEAPLIEPIRSARLIDPLILDQLGHVLFGFAGGIGYVRNLISHDPHITDIDFFRDYSAYLRDPNRVAPYNLYSSTATLWALDARDHTPPAPLFTYADATPSGPPATLVHVPFSSYSDVWWHYVASTRTYDRYYGNVPATDQAGRPITTTNIVVQEIDSYTTPYVENSEGATDIGLDLVGSGPLLVFRDGVVISGHWERSAAGAPTRLLDARGQQIPLARGRTWIELVPLHSAVFAHDTPSYEG